jgi:hypothetical protein
MQSLHIFLFLQNRSFLQLAKEGLILGSAAVANVAIMVSCQSRELSDFYKKLHPDAADSTFALFSNEIKTHPL